MRRCRHQDCLVDVDGERLARVPMKRLYVRAYRGRGYQPIGWICLARGHVQLEEGWQRSIDADRRQKRE